MTPTLRLAAATTPAKVPAPLPLHAVLLIVAVCAAAIGQGAYYATGQRTVALSLAGALGCLILQRKLRWPHIRFPVVVVSAGLACWVMLSAAVADDIGSARSTVALLAGVVIVLVGCRLTSAEHRGLLAVAAVAVASMVACTGWAGVAWRIQPWALEDQRLWRAASVLTYSNAAAGLMVPVALLALGRLVASRRSAPGAVAVCVLLTGIGACLSRGGFLALAFGGLLLAVVVGFRPLLLALVAPATGASIALAGIAPSIPAGSPPRPLLACVTLAVGLGTAAALARASDRSKCIAGAAAALVIAAGLVLATSSGSNSSLSAIQQPRLSVSSPDRLNEAVAAMRLAADHPWTGVGPNRASFSWTDADGTRLTARYAHNEYLHMASELGLIGFAFVLALMIVIGRLVALGRATAPLPAQWAGAVAGLAAFAMHSAFDFLWHVPAVPLVVAMLAGIGGPVATQEET